MIYKNVRRIDLAADLLADSPSVFEPAVLEGPFGIGIALVGPFLELLLFPYQLHNFLLPFPNQINHLRIFLCLEEVVKYIFEDCRV